MVSPRSILHALFLASCHQSPLDELNPIDVVLAVVKHALHIVVVLNYHSGSELSQAIKDTLIARLIGCVVGGVVRPPVVKSDCVNSQV